ncbi:hypothetical protein HGRIS_008958 [Hohenbuehelia grisea]|uniref:Uncharacterized protein n=1 Tax=Hohenbuehelia grisea TaxID=104357 RepID=A0ABR3IZT3_9AGAR
MQSKIAIAFLAFASIALGAPAPESYPGSDVDDANRTQCTAGFYGFVPGSTVTGRIGCNFCPTESRVYQAYDIALTNDDLDQCDMITQCCPGFCCPPSQDPDGLTFPKELLEKQM